MSRSRTSASRRSDTIAKPRGVIHPRVQAVGADHFGIVCFDCAKARSKFLLADFMGRVLVPPTVVEHNQTDIQQAIDQLRQAFQEHQLHDGLVAIERTGRHHQIVQRAFLETNWETRIIHPFVTKQYRAAVDPGYKTDDTDLFAIHRATVTGCALQEAPRDLAWSDFLLLVRHRRDLVRKRAGLNCQIRDHLQAAWPGFAECFHDFWDSLIPWHLLENFPSVEQLRDTPVTHLCHSLRKAKIRFQTRTLDTLHTWAETASKGADVADRHRRIALALYEDRKQKTAQIQGVEREIASALAKTPYVLLLSIPGINVVSAGDLAAELGPLWHYANAQCITGRAGLRPARYQSDRVDRTKGKLILHCNRSLRAALMNAADNLIVCNNHFRGLAEHWKTLGKQPHQMRVNVASRLSRILFAMIAKGEVFCHPCCQERHYLLDKLMRFHGQRQTPMDQVMADLNHAIKALPSKEYHAEAEPLEQEYQRIEQGRRRGPQPLGEILPIVLARLGVGVVESEESGE